MENSTETISWLQQVWQDLSYPGVILLFLYILFGVIGNAVVLIVYGKDKKLTGRVYIVCLAVIDLFAFLVVLPQTPVFAVVDNLPSLRVFGMVYAAQSVMMLQSYLFTQTVMALDQFVAVRYAFEHRRLSRKIKRLTFVAAAIVIVFFTIYSVVSRAYNFVENLQVLYACIALIFLLLMVSCFVVLLVVYPMIVLKLYEQQRKVRPKVTQNEINRVSNKFTPERDERKVTSCEAERNSHTRNPHKGVPVLRGPKDETPAAFDPDNKASAACDPDNKAPAACDPDDKAPPACDPERGMPLPSIRKSSVPTSQEPPRGLAAPPKPLGGLASSREASRRPVAAGAGKTSSHDVKSNVQSMTARKLHVQAIKIYSAIFLLCFEKA